MRLNRWCRFDASLIALPGIVIALALTLAIGSAEAQSPFGIATPDGSVGFGGPLSPIFSWIAQRQAEFYRILTGALADIKENGWAVWLLLAVSFAYGVFHAAGPGHGKAVISAYVLSSGETVRRGIVISFAAAFVQAASAIAIVLVMSVALRVTAQSMTRATEWIEIVSYLLITIVGAWLLWSKIFGRGHHHHHHHHHHSGHAANADPRRRGWTARWSAIAAVGIRPCSGAIIILVFSLAQGLFVAGIAATLVMAVGTGLTVAVLATLAVSAKGFALSIASKQSSLAAGFLKTIEIAAALAVLLFGLLLLGGALSSGRLGDFS